MASKTQVIIPKSVTIDFLRRQYELAVACKPNNKKNAKKLSQSFGDVSLSVCSLYF